MDHNPPRFEIIESDDESDDHTMSSEEVELEEAPPVDEAIPTMLQQPITTSSPTVPTVSTTSANDKFFKKLSENILLGVNAAFEKNRESELSKFCLLLGLLERQAQGNEEHQQVLVRKLDEMGTKISSMIASELMGIRADIDRMNMLHKASTDIFLAQLHGMTDPTKVTGPSTTDMTTPLPMDRLKLTFQTPPTPTPHLPPRDDGTSKGPPKGSFSPTKPMSRGNSQPTYIGQSPRTHHPGISPCPLDETPEGHQVHQTLVAVMEEEVVAQEEAQAEAQAEMMVEAMVEDHPAEDHQENLLETPQEETSRGEMTLGTMMSLTMRIQTTIWRMTRTEAIPLHQGEPQPPQAITGTSSIPQHGELTHPGQKPWAKECRKSATMPSVNAFMKPFRTQLARYSDGHQSPLAPTHT